MPKNKEGTAAYNYATRLYKRLTLGDQANKYVWPQNQVLIYNVYAIQFNNVLRFIIAYRTGHHNIKSTILMLGKVHIIRTKYLRTVDSLHIYVAILSVTYKPLTSHMSLLRLIAVCVQARHALIINYMPKQKDTSTFTFSNP